MPTRDLLHTAVAGGALRVGRRIGVGNEIVAVARRAGHILLM